MTNERKWRHEDGIGVKRTKWSQELMTPMEFMSWLAETIPQDGYEAMISPGVCVTWYSPRTQEEQESHDRWLEEHTARREAWERRTYEELKAKFENEDPSAPHASLCAWRLREEKCDCEVGLRDVQH